MSAPLLFGCLWVIAAAVTAMLPMRRQMVPGIGLLVTAPMLLVWIGVTHGWVWLAIGIAALASMMRNPLIHLWRRARGLPVQIPPELMR